MPASFRNSCDVLYMVWYGLLAQPRNRKRAAQKLIVCRHNQVKVDLDKKEAIKALQRNTSKEEPKMAEWIPKYPNPKMCI